MLMIYIY
jgi:hypothetical protein